MESTTPSIYEAQNRGAIFRTQTPSPVPPGSPCLLKKKNSRFLPQKDVLRRQSDANARPSRPRLGRPSSSSSSCYSATGLRWLHYHGFLWPAGGDGGDLIVVVQREGNLVGKVLGIVGRWEAMGKGRIGSNGVRRLDP